MSKTQDTSGSSSSPNNTCIFGDSRSLVYSWRCFETEFQASWYVRSMLFYSLLMIILTSTLNIIVIVYIIKLFWKFRSKTNTKITRTPLSILFYKTNMSFVSNAFVDLVYCWLGMPLRYVSILFGHWPFSDDTCRVFIMFVFPLSTCSMLHVLIIAYDRFMSLKRPFKSTNLQRSVHNFIFLKNEMRFQMFKLVMAYFIAFFAWMPLFALNLDPNMIERTKCYMNLKINGYILLGHSVFVYYLPILAIISLYGLSFYYLRQNVKKVQRSKEINSYRRREAKVLKRLVIVTLMFLSCWLPFCVVWNYRGINGFASVPQRIVSLVQLLKYFNALINPMIVIITNLRYHYGVKQQTQKSLLLGKFQKS